MLPPEYHLLRRVEDRHWWHAVLRALVGAVCDTGLPPRACLLDAGCGTGGILAHLRDQHPLLETQGIDASGLAVHHCHGRGLAQVRQGSVHQMPFPDDTFDAVLSLDVLYHADVDEDVALAEMRRVLRPGGVLVANVPAFECLRGAHDAAVCGARRYNAAGVRQMLERHDLRCERLQYWNAWLFLPLLMWRRLSRRPAATGGATSDLAPPPAWLNPLLAAGGRLDARLCHRLRIPFGSSIFTVARKLNRPAGGAAA